MKDDIKNQSTLKISSSNNNRIEIVSSEMILKIEQDNDYNVFKEIRFFLKINHIELLDWFLFSIILSFMPIYIRFFLDNVINNKQSINDFIPDIAIASLLLAGYCIKEILVSLLWKEHKILSMIVIFISIFVVILDAIIFTLVYIANLPNNTYQINILLIIQFCVYCCIMIFLINMLIQYFICEAIYTKKVHIKRVRLKNVRLKRRSLHLFDKKRR